MSEPEEWIFTFGVGHEYGQRFVRIPGDFNAARKRMVERFGTKWAFQYPSEDAAGVDKYHLTELR